ncbi:transporter [Natrialba sp. SSL1]|nr:transporter [Natrialba sp. SSL1]OIB56389.1 transporter [Natrialba sp. SSL1]
MVRLSTILILVGIVLLIAPVPPIGVTLGPIAIVLGILLRVLTDL